MQPASRVRRSPYPVAWYAFLILWNFASYVLTGRSTVSPPVAISLALIAGQ